MCSNSFWPRSIGSLCLCRCDMCVWTAYEGRIYATSRHCMPAPLRLLYILVVISDSRYLLIECVYIQCWIFGHCNMPYHILNRLIFRSVQCNCHTKLICSVRMLFLSVYPALWLGSISASLHKHSHFTRRSVKYNVRSYAILQVIADVNVLPYT